MEAKTTLTLARTRVKSVLIFSKIENAALCSLPWTQVANFIFQKGQYFVATYRQQLSRLPTTMFTLKHSIVAQTPRLFHLEKTDHTRGYRTSGIWSAPKRSAVTVGGWLLNIPATGWCTSGTDLLRQSYVQVY